MSKSLRLSTVLGIFQARMLVPQLVKNLPTMWETWVRSWVGKIPWRRERLPTPVLWPGESPWTEGPGSLQPMGSQRSRHDWTTKHSTERTEAYSWLFTCNHDFFPLNLIFRDNLNSYSSEKYIPFIMSFCTNTFCFLQWALI